MAKPRGLPFGSVSGICGMPVELEKRAMIGVEGFWKCGARDNVFAVEVLVKWPFRRMPLA
jgi:hypothetical protein